MVFVRTSSNNFVAGINPFKNTNGRFPIAKKCTSDNMNKVHKIIVAIIVVIIVVIIKYSSCQGSLWRTTQDQSVRNK